MLVKSVLQVHNEAEKLLRIIKSCKTIPQYKAALQMYGRWKTLPDNARRETLVKEVNDYLQISKLEGRVYQALLDKLQELT
jgi:hypothetical protein